MACLACSMRFRNLPRFGSNNATSKRSRQSVVSFGCHDGLLSMNGAILADLGPIVKLIVRFYRNRPVGQAAWSAGGLVFDPVVISANSESAVPMAVSKRSIAYLQGRACDHRSDHSSTGQNTKVFRRECPGGQFGGEIHGVTPPRGRAAWNQGSGGAGAPGRIDDVSRAAAQPLRGSRCICALTST